MSISFRFPNYPTLPMLLGTSALAVLSACGGSSIFGGSSKSAPSITTQPTSVTTVVGRRVQFVAGVSGKPTPDLVWRKDGVDITSQKSSTCKIDDPKLTDAGQYTLYASNERGNATSNPASLGVLAVPTLVAPFGVAVDSASNLYVSDSSRHVIYKITYSGGNYSKSVLAGSEDSSGSADLTGTAASFNTPQGLALDPAGNLYVADYGNHTIRKITSGGIVTTLAGTAGAFGTADDTGASARFNHPVGVALDSSATYLYVADSGNQTIRRIQVSTGAVSTFAGTAGTVGSTNGSSGLFSSPNGVVVDSSGNVYVADYGNSTIRMITSGGVVSLLAGSPGQTDTTNGTGGSARFHWPVGIVLDASGNLLVADAYNHAIRKVTTAGVVTTLAGEAGVAANEDETGTAAHFNTPTGLCVDSSGYAFVADYKNGLIRRVSSAGVVATVTSTGVIATSPYAD